MNRLRGAADLALDIGRVGGFDVSEFKTIFDNIYMIVDAWQKASATDAVSIFNLEIKEKKIEIEKRLKEVAVDDIERVVA